MALMLLVSGLGNLGTVLAEDVPDKYIKENIERINRDILDTRANNPYTFDYGSYFTKKTFESSDADYTVSEHYVDTLSDKSIIFYTYPLTEEGRPNHANIGSYEQQYKTTLSRIDPESENYDPEFISDGYCIEIKNKNDIINYYRKQNSKDFYGDAVYFIIISDAEKSIINGNFCFLIKEKYLEYTPLIKEEILKQEGYSFYKNDVSNILKKTFVELLSDNNNENKASIGLLDYGNKIKWISNKINTDSALKDNVVIGFLVD